MLTAREVGVLVRAVELSIASDITLSELAGQAPVFSDLDRATMRELADDLRDAAAPTGTEAS